MHADWIDRWGGVMQRLSLHVSFASLGILGLAGLAALILPRGSQMVLTAILDQAMDTSYSVTLPKSDGSFRIKIRQLPLFHKEFRYQPSVLKATEQGETSLGSKGTWDGLRPLVIYEQGPDAIAVRFHGRGYDTYGVAAAGSPRRFLGLVRMETVRGRKRLLFIDGRAVQECDPDGGVDRIGALPACPRSRAD